MGRTIVVAVTLVLVVAGAAYIAFLLFEDDSAKEEAAVRDIERRLEDIHANETAAIKMLRELTVAQALSPATTNISSQRMPTLRPTSALSMNHVAYCIFLRTQLTEAATHSSMIGCMCSKSIGAHLDQYSAPPCSYF